MERKPPYVVKTDAPPANATAQPKQRRPSEDDIITDDAPALCSVCGNPLECDGECLLCERVTKWT